MERKIQQSSTIVNFCWRAKRRRWPESQRLQVLQGESEELFNELLEHYMQTHQPQSATEASLVETMTVACWRLWRVWGAQKLALDHDIAVQDPDIGPTSVRAMFAMRGSVDNPKVDVLLRYETAFDRQFKSALRLLESLSKHRKPSAKPYFPAHPFGHTWKPEACGADLPVEPETSDPQNQQEKIPGTARPQEVAETRTPQKADPTTPTHSIGRKSRADPQVRSRRPRRPSSATLPTPHL